MACITFCPTNGKVLTRSSCSKDIKIRGIIGPCTSKFIGGSLPFFADRESSAAPVGPGTGGSRPTGDWDQDEVTSDPATGEASRRPATTEQRGDRATRGARGTGRPGEREARVGEICSRRGGGARAMTREEARGRGKKTTREEQGRGRCARSREEDDARGPGSSGADQGPSAPTSDQGPEVTSDHRAEATSDHRPGSRGARW
ncbi:hypothetical protein Syun_012205 [Stephania yunnanensis]|uniref:Uncharacterized protein n=1 Tax=Stephania yunnanensis TaxID=152371 RepID=A0AAP0K018_9MAGN